MRRLCDRPIVAELPSPQLQSSAAGACRLQGPLNFASVPALWQRVPVWQSAVAEGRLQCDLADVQAIDSAGLALLVAWQAQATAAGIGLEYLNVPPRALALARISEAVDLLAARSTT